MEKPMDIQLHFLESFRVQGADGRSYKVCAYERMGRDASMPHGIERWEPTGVIEYRLEDGRLVDARRDGTLRIAGTAIELQRSAADASA
jgi:hypothetical protein